MDPLEEWCQQNNLLSLATKLRELSGFSHPSELGEISAADVENIIGQHKMNYGEQTRFRRAVHQLMPPKRPDFVDRTLKALEEAQLTPSQLYALGQGIAVLYASQANAVVQSLPLDMWRIIFNGARIDVLPILVLLGLRTVCRSWNQLICSYKTINFDERDFQVNKLAHIFTLDSLDILEDSQIDFGLFTQLKELTIGIGRSKGSIFSSPTNPLSRLSNLTHLTLSSNFLTSLCPLPSLCSLHLREPILLTQGSTTHLRNLTRLVSEKMDFIQTGKGVYHNPANGDTFDGEFFGGWLHYGTLQNDKLGYHYQGSFQGSLWKPNGFGVLVSHKNYSRFEGQFRHGMKHGDGIYTCPAFRYEGMFHLNEIEGVGVLFMTDGKVYEGTFNQIISDEGKTFVGKGNRFTRTGQAKPFEKEFDLKTK